MTALPYRPLHRKYVLQPRFLDMYPPRPNSGNRSSGESFVASLVETLDKIVTIHHMRAKHLLSHHVKKYGRAPVLRAGVTSYIQSQLDSVLLPTDQDPLGLDAATRRYFRRIHNQFPNINVAERRVLARVTGVPEAVVAEFFVRRRRAQAPWYAMRAFMVARELEVLRAQPGYAKDMEDLAERRRQKQHELLALQTELRLKRDLAEAFKRGGKAAVDELVREMRAKFASTQVFDELKGTLPFHGPPGTGAAAAAEPAAAAAPATE